MRTKKFKLVHYDVRSEKIKNQKLVFAMVSDLHNVVFGEKNENLMRRLREEKPDAILAAGDLVLGKKGASLTSAYEFLKGAMKIAPVFYALGNHEQRMKRYPGYYGGEYLRYEKKVKKLGVSILENETASLQIKGESIRITGLALPYAYYEKDKNRRLEQRELKQLLGKASKEEFQVLLAHNPKYAEAYLDWGSDLTFCGHYHGGIVRLPLLGGVVSPDLRFFPPYCHGMFAKEERRLLVGAGLGEHTIPRILNPRELVLVTCMPKPMHP